MATSAFGALIAVKLPETVVKLVVGISMAVLVVFIAVYRKNSAPVAPTPARRWAGFIGTTLLGVYGGFFSGGYTTLMTVLCTVCFGLTMMESVAVTKPINLLSCVAASAWSTCASAFHWRRRTCWAAGSARTPRSRGAIASSACCSSAPSRRWH